MNYFDHSIRVRYGETDQMGVSYYANYFVWMEASRSDYFRELDLPYTEFEKKGLFLPVTEANCKYFSPSFYDQLIFIRVSVAEIKRSSMKFTYQVLNRERSQILAWGYTVHCFINQDRKPVRVPDEVREKVDLHELDEKNI